MAASPRQACRSGCCRSSSTAPGAIGGSWAGSPTSTSRALAGRASSSAAIKARSTIDTSSTTNRSRGRGWWRLRTKWSPRLSSRRCRVPQGWRPPVAARRRAAALPVGAASWTRVAGSLSSAAASMRATVLVLPVPGPPWSNTSRWVCTASTAWYWRASRVAVAVGPTELPGIGAVVSRACPAGASGAGVGSAMSRGRTRSSRAESTDSRRSCQRRQLSWSASITRGPSGSRHNAVAASASAASSGGRGMESRPCSRAATRSAIRAVRAGLAVAP